MESIYFQTPALSLSRFNTFLQRKFGKVSPFKKSYLISKTQFVAAIDQVIERGRYYSLSELTLILVQLHGIARAESWSMSPINDRGIKGVMIYCRFGPLLPCIYFRKQPEGYQPRYTVFNP